MTPKKAEKTYQSLFWLTQKARDRIRDIGDNTGLTYSQIVERLVLGLPVPTHRSLGEG